MSGAPNWLAGHASECLLFGQIQTSSFSRLILEPGQETALEIAGRRVLFWTLFLLPLNELFKQSLGFFGRFFSRSSGGGLGNSRGSASLRLLKLPETLKQCLGVFGRHLGRRSRCRS
jgi:hypothetical protein